MCVKCLFLVFKLFLLLLILCVYKYIICTLFLFKVLNLYIGLNYCVCLLYLINKFFPIHSIICCYISSENIINIWVETFLKASPGTIIKLQWASMGVEIRTDRKWEHETGRRRHPANDAFLNRPQVWATVSQSLWETVKDSGEFELSLRANMGSPVFSGLG